MSSLTLVVVAFVYSDPFLKIEMGRGIGFDRQEPPESGALESDPQTLRPLNLQLWLRMLTIHLTRKSSSSRARTPRPNVTKHIDSFNLLSDLFVFGWQAT